MQSASISAIVTRIARHLRRTESVRLADAGSVVISTAVKVSGGVSPESLNPKSAVDKVYEGPGATLTVCDVPEGA